MNRVLISDDSLLHRNTHSTIVIDAGYEVDTTCKGQEAFEKIQADHHAHG